MAQRYLHLAALGFLVSVTLAGVSIWIAVQSTRDEPLPSLVWAPQVHPEAIFALGLPVRDQLSDGWWWIEASPEERAMLRVAGARIVVAMPTPVARMAGCSGDVMVSPAAPAPRI